MVNYVTKKRETKSERGGLCIDEDEARYYFIQVGVQAHELDVHAYTWCLAGLGKAQTTRRVGWVGWLMEREVYLWTTLNRTLILDPLSLALHSAHSCCQRWSTATRTRWHTGEQRR